MEKSTIASMPLSTVEKTATIIADIMGEEAREKFISCLFSKIHAKA